jgi:CheY-like chemotaxis protein
MSDEVGGLQCVLIADSEVLVRNALAEYLRHCGYRVIQAATSDEVIEVFQHGTTTPAAILCDVALGGTMNGFELRGWLRENASDVHVALAGSVDKAAQAAGKLCDDGPHLKRPYDPQSVAEHIKRLLAQARN